MLGQLTQPGCAERGDRDGSGDGQEREPTYLRTGSRVGLTAIAGVTESVGTAKISTQFALPYIRTRGDGIYVYARVVCGGHARIVALSPGVHERGCRVVVVEVNTGLG